MENITNRIPPLHPASPPPLHPASPPPFSKCNLYEDDVDENDDFGNYTIATSDFGENIYRDSPEAVQHVEVYTQENILPVSGTVSSSCITENLATTCNTTKQSSVLKEISKNREAENKIDDETLTSYDTWSCFVDIKQNNDADTTTSHINKHSSIGEDTPVFTNDHNSPNEFINSDNIGNTSVINFDENSKNESLDTNNSEFEIGKLELANEKIFENPSDEIFSQVKELIPSEITENVDSVEESSDDSSAVINETAFVVVENRSDIEEDIFDDDGFQEFIDYKTEKINENINLNVDTSDLNTPSEFKHVHEKEISYPHMKDDYINDDLFFSSNFEESAIKSSSTVKEGGVNRKSFDFDGENEVPAQIDWLNSHKVTTNCPPILDTPQIIESSLVPDKSADVFTEDDDFDDFVSPPSCNTQTVEQLPSMDEASVPHADELSKLPNVSSDTRTHSIDLLSGNTTECWSHIFQYTGEDLIEVNVNTLEGKLNGSSVWCKIKNIETSPALNYNWNDSETKKMLLATLGVDSRNILFGPRWNSEVPRFASNLGFSPLVPQKTSNGGNELQNSCPIAEEPVIESTSDEVDPQVSTVVRDAHFDWNSSGLTNPLDTRKSDKIVKASVAVSQLDYDQSSKDDSSTSQVISAEATKILNSLPNLLVMEKQYIVFSVR